MKFKNFFFHQNHLIPFFILIIAVAADVSHLNRNHQQSSSAVRGNIRHGSSQATQNKAQYHQNYQYRSNPYANNPYRGKNRYSNRQQPEAPATSEQPPYNYPPPNNTYLPPDNTYLPPNQVRRLFYLKFKKKIKKSEMANYM